MRQYGLLARTTIIKQDLRNICERLLVIFVVFLVQQDLPNTEVSRKNPQNHLNNKFSFYKQAKL